MGRLSNLSSPLLSRVLLSFQLTPCRLAFTLAKATWCANSEGAGSEYEYTLGSH